MRCCSSGGSGGAAGSEGCLVGAVEGLGADRSDEGAAVGLCAAEEGERTHLPSRVTRTRASLSPSLLCFCAAAAESGRSPQPAEELPRSTAAVRLLRVRAETAQGIHEGEPACNHSISYT